MLLFFSGAKRQGVFGNHIPAVFPNLPEEKSARIFPYIRAIWGM